MQQGQKPPKQSFISELFPDWRPTREQLLWTTRIAIVLAVLLGLLTLIGIPLRISLYEWLQLLIVPGVIVAGGLWFNRQQRQRELEIAERRSQDEALQAYIDEISQLLADKERPLHRAPQGDPLSVVAQARTLTVLPRLGAGHKRSALQFLYESRLIEGQQPVVSLVEADLSGTHLYTANWSGANLRGAYLPYANLNNANLSKADLSEATLGAAALNNANLNSADLSRAELVQSNLNAADLSEADLRGARLSVTIGSESIGSEFIQRERLSGHLRRKLDEGTLGEAEWQEVFAKASTPVTMKEVDLRAANLSDANLSGADLSGAEGDIEALLVEQAATLEGATMPNGKKFEEWLEN